MSALSDRIRWWGRRPGAALAVTTALLALALAAGNWIEASGELLLIAGAACLVALAEAAYRSMPVVDRERVFTRVFVKRAAVGSSLAGIAIGSIYWYAGWLVRFDVPLSIVKTWVTLDFVPSVFSTILPDGWRSHFHHYFAINGTYCFPGPFWWESMVYLRTAIPAYAITFFLATVSLRLIAIKARAK